MALASYFILFTPASRPTPSGSWCRNQGKGRGVSEDERRWAHSRRYPDDNKEFFNEFPIILLYIIPYIPTNTLSPSTTRRLQEWRILNLSTATWFLSQSY